jgi:hypothetical protein
MANITYIRPTSNLHYLRPSSSRERGIELKLPDSVVYVNNFFDGTDIVGQRKSKEENSKEMLKG